MDANYTQVVITLITVIGSAGIWKFLEARLKTKSEERKHNYLNDDRVQYRDDLKDRVRNLEALLAKSADEKNDLNEKILALTAEVSQLKVMVEYLQKENERLKNVR